MHFLHVSEGFLLDEFGDFSEFSTGSSLVSHLGDDAGIAGEVG
jgi:hypothetical protein